jgi:hypothetical protein
MDKIAKLVGQLFGALIVGIIIVAINGYFVMALWNWLVVELFRIPSITFLQGCGLVLLVSFLFRGGIRASNKS